MCGREGDEGFVVRDQVKWPRSEVVREMVNCCVEGQQLAIKGGVRELRLSQLSGEKGEWLPMIVDLLLEHCAHGDVGGVGGDP